MPAGRGRGGGSQPRPGWLVPRPPPVLVWWASINPGAGPGRVAARKAEGAGGTMTGPGPGRRHCGCRQRRRRRHSAAHLTEGRLSEGKAGVCNSSPAVATPRVATYLGIQCGLGQSDNGAAGSLRTAKVHHGGLRCRPNR